MADWKPAPHSYCTGCGHAPLEIDEQAWGSAYRCPGCGWEHWQSLGD